MYLNDRNKLQIGYVCSVDYDDEDGNVYTESYNSVQSAINGIVESGQNDRTIKMLVNSTMSDNGAEFYTGDKTLQNVINYTLDLNGKYIDCSACDEYALYVYPGTNVTITDSKSKAGVAGPGAIKNGISAINVLGSLTLDSGVITGFSNIYSQNAGTAVTVSSFSKGSDTYSGKFVMNDGYIYGNGEETTSVGSMASPVYVDTGAEFIMNGGVIGGNGSDQAGNVVYGCGGGVTNHGTFTLNDGEIAYNEALYGLKVRYAGYAGGVFNDGMFNMAGGKIYNNQVNSYGGGGVYNAYRVDDAGNPTSVFNMTGGGIYGNVVDNDGSAYGMGVMNYCVFTMNGEDAFISNNYAQNFTESYGGGVYNQGTFTLLNGHIGAYDTYDGNTAD